MRQTVEHQETKPHIEKVLFVEAAEPELESKPVKMEADYNPFTSVRLSFWALCLYRGSNQIQSSDVPSHKNVSRKAARRPMPMPPPKKSSPVSIASSKWIFQARGRAVVSNKDDDLASFLEGL